MGRLEKSKKTFYEGDQVFIMTPNETIYLINQNSELLKAWRELSEAQKRMVVEACQTIEDPDLEKVIKEVAFGQRRLF